MYFFDTYALIQTARGVSSYSSYLKAPIITTKLNLLELAFVLIRDGEKEKASAVYAKFKPFCVSISDPIFLKAAEMRYQFRNLHLSYIDCIGYLLSRSLGIPFLTGDREFRDLEGVEFVK